MLTLADVLMFLIEKGPGRTEAELAIAAGSGKVTMTSTFGAVVSFSRRVAVSTFACPCMGNVLSVPLSTVTLTEDVLMVAMAIMLLMAN